MSLKLLLDENLSPEIAEQLRGMGYDAVHVRDVGIKGCKDHELIAYAR